MKFKFSYEPVESWSVKPPQSKSYLQRALLVASLAAGRSRVVIDDVSDDVKAMSSALRLFGVKINGNTVHGSMPLNPGKIIMCGESGATIRFLTSYSTLVDRGYTVLTGKAGLLKRPIAPLVNAIVNLGGWATTLSESAYPPVIIRAQRMSGGGVTINSSDSSQYLSSLLMVLPYSAKTTSIRAESLVSRPYVDMTLHVMKTFGVDVEVNGGVYTVRKACYRPAEFEPPADASSAAFFISLALLSGRRVVLKGINENAPQADLLPMLKVMNELGVPHEVAQGNLNIGESRISGMLEVDLRNSPDSLPPLSVLGLKVKIKITGVGHARIKESDRISAISSELSKLGAKVEEAPDGITISPPLTPRKGIKLNGWNDHRIVMAMSVADAALELGSTIENYENVSKSYPRFFDDMAALGYRVVPVE
ncbi:MAG: 3-phosphoshikimate 1-carboxyvinyltransferase [Nitrososphaerota archaeon]|nr:3-phosphoshikimate 1-carboxyvinyltransferase [Nitrososphaerota archaeon]MDG6932796.1 3-phosphoshikimate 1-carboxyvinyltransferase [Nitrososphaerota archaeon]MDG6944624.1 3-phosphoshikimate 1-carboxyvinyltransferase [Nitrososphaerota archaeon]